MNDFLVEVDYSFVQFALFKCLIYLFTSPGFSFNAENIVKIIYIDFAKLKASD